MNDTCWTENWKPKCLDVSRSRVVSDLVDHRVGPGLDAKVRPPFGRRTPWLIGAWRGTWVELHEHLLTSVVAERCDRPDAEPGGSRATYRFPRAVRSGAAAVGITPWRVRKILTEGAGPHSRHRETLTADRHASVQQLEGRAVERPSRVGVRVPQRTSPASASAVSTSTASPPGSRNTPARQDRTSAPGWKRPDHLFLAQGFSRKGSRCCPTSARWPAARRSRRGV